MSLPLRVYYEDTDAGGVVYYANYLKFLERGRTELLRTLGFEQWRLLQEAGVAFAVRELAVDYLRPARLDDWLVVETAIAGISRVQVTFAQRIVRADELLLTARVRIASLDTRRNRPTKMPLDLFECLSACR
ncbi:MAG: tol-pal system-associated acyl-CoA thioesterase [Rhodocyclaceae bacterium]|nr:tol-pal system-associated acyl-CoA thioesterase [Rhodocyclaceae bacterium]